MTKTHLAILILCWITPACDSAVPVGPALPTAPTLLATNPNYTGEWRGGWRVISCTDQPPRLGYCASNSQPDFEYARLVLTQSTGTITGRMQARIGDGPVTGRVDELGRLRLQGTLPSVPSRFPVTRITDWRSVINPADGSLVTGFTIDHLWGTDLSLAARSVNEMVIPFCPRPSTVGFFWEC